MAKANKKHAHSFSTNFFGVSGYIGSTLVWLLVFVCTLRMMPYGEQSNVMQELTGSREFVVAQAESGLPPELALLLSALLVIVFWAFAYFASRILTRAVRRIVGLFHRRTKKDQAHLFFSVKLFIHTLALVFLVPLLILVPALIWEKAAIGLLGMIGGILGLSAILLQRLAAKRHKVPYDQIL